MLGRLIKDFKQALFENGDAFSLDSRLNPDLPLLASLVAELEQALHTSVYMQPGQRWLAMENTDDLLQWAQKNNGPAAGSLTQILQRGWSSQGASDRKPLPELDSAELFQRLQADDADEFIAHPQWQGQTFETTPLARQLQHPMVQSLSGEFDHTLLTRWVARLVELARIPEQIRLKLAEMEKPAEAAARNNRVLGLAQTEAARGRLVHRVAIDNDIVTQYQILAPTEWNFHPRGLINQSLEHLSGDDPAQIEPLARVMINAIDPCVGYDLRVH